MGDGRRLARHAIHPEGNHADPGVAVVSVDREAGRKETGHLVDGDGPMGEEEIVPALRHAPTSGGQRIRAVRDGAENIGHP
jgi:hypothetical protein